MHHTYGRVVYSFGRVVYSFGRARRHFARPRRYTLFILHYLSVGRLKLCALFSKTRRLITRSAGPRTLLDRAPALRFLPIDRSGSRARRARSAISSRFERIARSIFPRFFACMDDETEGAWRESDDKGSREVERSRGDVRTQRSAKQRRKRARRLEDRNREREKLSGSQPIFPPIRVLSVC